MSGPPALRAVVRSVSAVPGRPAVPGAVPRRAGELRWPACRRADEKLATVSSREWESCACCGAGNSTREGCEGQRPPTALARSRRTRPRRSCNTTTGPFARTIRTSSLVGARPGAAKGSAGGSSRSALALVPPRRATPAPCLPAGVGGSPRRCFTSCQSARPRAPGWCHWASRCFSPEVSIGRCPVRMCAISLAPCTILAIVLGAGSRSPVQRLRCASRAESRVRLWRCANAGSCRSRRATAPECSERIVMSLMTSYGQHLAATRPRIRSTASRRRTVSLCAGLGVEPRFTKSSGQWRQLMVYEAFSATSVARSDMP